MYHYLMLACESAKLATVLMFTMVVLRALVVPSGEIFPTDTLLKLLIRYRESLHGKWGILDIQDAHQSVVELGKLGLADTKRACIYGGSAGGYSTLQAATTLPDAFAAGAALYGISDMKKLDDILHKFEYHLCDRLMGSSYKDNVQLWKDRSPIFNVDKIKMPLLVCITSCLVNHDGG